MKAGHELFQECRKPVANLVEQLATGFHETHDVSFFAEGAGPHESPEGNIGKIPSQPSIGDVFSSSGSGVIGAQPGIDGLMGKHENHAKKGSGNGGAGMSSEMFEDRFIDNVLGALHDVRQQGSVTDNPFRPASTDVRRQAKEMQQQQWKEYSMQMQNSRSLCLEQPPARRPMRRGKVEVVFSSKGLAVARIDRARRDGTSHPSVELVRERPYLIHPIHPLNGATILSTNPHRRQRSTQPTFLR